MPPFRALSHPFFFPPTSPPPSSISPSPTQPPSPAPFPKYPSTTTNTLPFFPTYPSPPPPPPPSTLPTFPANISSLTLPNSSHSAPAQTHNSNLILAIGIPILAVFILVFILTLVRIQRYNHRQRCRTRNVNVPDDSHYDSHRLFPPNTAPSDIPKLDTSSRPTSSEFMYVGTVVGSLSEAELASLARPAARSPELRPIPLLTRQFKRADAACSSEEEFYSPKASPTSRRTFQAAALKSSSSSSSSPSPSSPTTSSLPVSSSLSASTIESLSTKKGFNGDAEKGMEQRSKLSCFSDGNTNPFLFGPPESKPPPPPPPPLVPPRYDRVEDDRRVKLKALHWDKLPAISGRAMVWDQLKKSGSFQLNEEMVESLFVCNVTKNTMKGGQQAKAAVLDPKKSQNIAILLKALNVSKEDVCEALLEGDADSLGNELLETLYKMAPNKEEELKLKECGNDSSCKLGLAETFLKAILGIPFAFKRVDAMLYIANFNSEANHLKQSFQTLEAACEELRKSRLFLKLLEAVLKTGNRMNIGTNRGDAHAFKLDTLLKLVGIKGSDGKTTLLHFVAQEIIKAEGYRLLATGRNQANVLRDDPECKRLGLQVVFRLGEELSNVKKAAAMDSDVLSSSSTKLAAGIQKIRDVLRLNMSSVTENGKRFHEAMNEFLRMAEGEIVIIQAQEGVMMSLVRELTEYFHGDSAKEEAHPFRIFMVVRDFLSIFGQVCKEVSLKDEPAVIGSPWHSPVTVSIASPVSPGSYDYSETCFSV
ncbi:hypothetical protein J5N97_012552 [Dioscorea zingiberensis]|uniref:Formin-like protein n=1 Tax=Dioscorea zingiberensis TaxID=325984 RepID=A0A9D5CRV1_9LILI|nr:hypothetical protein J5N97_012552 [Dioscorea zingiberensis]